VTMKRFVFLFFILTGCYSRSHFESNLQTWVGTSSSQLIDGWGPPTGVFDLPDGRKMYTWANNSGAAAVPVAGTVYAVPLGCKITFTVSNTGTVEKWRYEGNNCY
jgi:hypothetical protein